MNDQDKRRFMEIYDGCCMNYGKEKNTEALKFFFKALSGYDIEIVHSAFQSHVLHCRFFPTIADIRERISLMAPVLARPGPDEAWALIPKDEEDSAILTDEMLSAWAAVHKLYESEGPIPARMAFIGIYNRKLAEAEAMGIPVRWSISQGWDKLKLAGVISEGIRLGKITKDQAQPYLHQLEHDATQTIGIAGLLANPKASISDQERDRILQRLSGVKESLKPKEITFDMNAVHAELEEFSKRMSAAWPDSGSMH